LTQGQIFKDSILADTLQKIANEGPETFYTGAVAQALLNDIQAIGGIITASDLANYTVKSRTPLTTYFLGYKIIGAYPPFSGAAVSMMALNILERFNLPLLYSTGNYSLAMHWLQESFRYAYSNRLALADPDYVNVTWIISEMLSKAHASVLRANLREDKTFPPSYYLDLTNETAIFDDKGTTHISVIDRQRNAVGVTSTINTLFGSKIRSISTGIVLNDEMDDFSSPNITNAFGYPPSTANYIVSGKRPLSSMTPTIVVKDGKLALVVGASGGSRIITATTWVLLHVLAFNKDVSTAISMPRMHCQLFPNTLEIEYGTPQGVIDKLAEVGNQIQMTSRSASAVQAISVSNDWLYSACDPRKGGQPAGN